MDKNSLSTQEDLDKLKTRLDFLEKENRWYFSALEMVASMGDMHREVPRSTNPTHLFDKARRHLKQLIPFKSVAFFLVHEPENNFVLAEGEPEEATGLKVELDNQIEKGTFAWALKQNRALIVESEVFKERLFLHVLATKSRIQGMVVGRLGPGVKRIPMEISTLIAILLHNTANALENGQLYRQLRDQNKNLEKTVQDRTQDLEKLTRELKKNIQELKDFAFVASHDLQEPLRKVISFGERLRTQYQDLLDPKAKEYIKVMGKATSHMQRLINSLLQLSKVTTRPGDIVPTQLDQVLTEVLNDMESSISRSQAQIMIGDLPTLKVDRIQIRQLFTHLLKNALQFRKPDVPPEISVTAYSRGDGLWEIWFSDNGIGFDQKHMERIFKPFERLHGRSERQGAGMGLAICRKIVDRHGGRITAKSSPGNGVTFMITLSE